MFHVKNYAQIATTESSEKYRGRDVKMETSHFVEKRVFQLAKCPSFFVHRLSVVELSCFRHMCYIGQTVKLRPVNVT